MNQDAEIIYIGVPQADPIFHGIVGGSLVMCRVYDAIRKVADTNATVLIEGPTGVGKELVARAIHKSSSRASKPFVAMNCGALPKDLIGDELFGHEKGAFTNAIGVRKGRFEAAHGGTLLLDDIATMPMELQPHLLRVLQECEIERLGSTTTIPIDVRLVVTTNIDLIQHVKAGLFREDLYHRLNVVQIMLPSLADRPDDIPLLISHFIDLYNQKHARTIKGINQGAVNRLMQYNWSGNVRQLQHMVECAVIMSNNKLLNESDFPIDVITAGNLESSGHVQIPMNMTVDDVHKYHVLNVLRQVSGNKTHASEVLGITRKTLNHYLCKWRKLSTLNVPEHWTTPSNGGRPKGRQHG